MNSTIFIALEHVCFTDTTLTQNITKLNTFWPHANFATKLSLPTGTVSRR